MQLFSTKNKAHVVNFKEAIFRGLPPDNGLYMPSVIASLPADFWANINAFSLPEIGFKMAQSLQQGAIPDHALHEIVGKAIDFPAPVVQLDEQKSVLELFHGPSLAFKDFGARYMARCMAYFNEGESRELVILVATSGDTGGAVAFGFHHVPGIKVVILYPSGKVSHLQEQQLTTLGDNVLALEVSGTFDDCQALVKQAFLDDQTTASIRLSSANSINIARLIPQSFYYAEAYKQVRAFTDKPVVFAVPSGNFGNLTAGLMAKRMGLPVHHFVAASNANDVVSNYLQTGKYQSRPSVQTLSNAMDVGNPSNFARMQDLYSSTWNMMRDDIWGKGVSDRETQTAMKTIWDTHGYVMDPHGSVGYKALSDYQQENPDTHGVVLETAHPAKFIDDVERILKIKVSVPERLEVLRHKEKSATPMQNDYERFKAWLLDNY
jgi:threonine synthase